MTYSVKTYEFFEWNSDPDEPPRYMFVGSYKNSDDAILACKRTIDKQFSKIKKEARDFDDAVTKFRLYDETPVIFGDPSIHFNVSEYLESLRTK